jgi:enamine deaminase RidA (YjgF/YER057c/UK114 family)
MASFVSIEKILSDTHLPKFDSIWRHSHAIEAIGTGGSGPEVFLTLKLMPGEAMLDLFTRLEFALIRLGATIVHMRVYGSTSAYKAGMIAMRSFFEHLDWPITWVEGEACDNQPIAALQVFAFIGETVNRIRMDGRVVGSVFTEGDARYCLLGGLGPNNKALSRGDQTRETLDNLARALAQGGFSLADTVRTWFFLDDILSWYGEFNQARTDIYSGMKFRTGSLPASTGVGARNPSGAALAVGAWAMQPLKPTARAFEVASPLQCPAPAYGSCFSRAMEIETSSGRRLLISGKASIAPEGKTLWLGDARQQVAQSMEVVEAMLHSRGYELSNLTRATAYFKHRDDARLFAEWCSSRALPMEHVTVAQCDICRDNLLFELEADAWSPTTSSAG